MTRAASLLFPLMATLALTCGPPPHSRAPAPDPAPRQAADHGGRARPVELHGRTVDTGLGLGGGLTTSAPRPSTRGGRGNVVATRGLYRKSNWSTQVRWDGRAELIFPVNVIRIYSDEHSADRIAMRGYIKTQLEAMNRLFSLSTGDMRRHNAQRLAPVLQFRLHRIIDVHERDVSRTIGFTMDTENLLMRGRQYNGVRHANTWDVRSVKVAGETTHLTIYYAWAGRAGHSHARWGGVSNLGFADLAEPRRVGALVQVSGRRSKMGPILFKGATPSTMAHEVGHYFDLPHAWDTVDNVNRSIRDCGDGPKTDVDRDATTDNVMDYGRTSRQYFTRQQLAHMVRFARRRAPALLAIERGDGRAPTPAAGRPGAGRPRPKPRRHKVRVLPPPAPRVPIPIVTPHPRPPARPPAKRGPLARIQGVRISPPGPAGAVTLKIQVRTANLTTRQLRLVAWFRDAQGQKLVDADGKWRTSTGHIAVGGRFRSTARDQTRTLTLTLPAGQLHLPPGRHALSARVGLFRDGELRHRFGPVPFRYHVPEPPRQPAAAAAHAAWLHRVRAKVRTGGAEPTVRLHVDVTLDNLKGQPVDVEARFQFTDGRVLRDFDRRYRSPEGHAYASRRLRSRYSRSKWSNVRVEIPVKELHLAAGQRVTLRAAVTIRHGGKILASKIHGPFVVSTAARPSPGQPPPPPRVAPRPVVRPPVTLGQVRLEHNVRRNGRYGMWVKARLEIRGYKNRPLTYTAWFFDSAGQPLRDRDGRFATGRGQVAASTTIRPIYDASVFSGLRVFVPYDQLHRRSGTWTLGVRVGVRGRRGPVVPSTSIHRFRIRFR